MLVFQFMPLISGGTTVEKLFQPFITYSFRPEAVAPYRPEL
jgi:hypothetical protein